MIFRFAPPRLFPYLLRHPVGAENHQRAIRDLVQFLDEHRAPFPKGVDDVPAVHDFMSHVNRCAVALQRHFDDFDGPVNTGAKSTWIGQIDLFHSDPSGPWENGLECLSSQTSRPFDIMT